MNLSLDFKTNALENLYRPCDWTMDENCDNWERTQDKRCDLYSPGQFIELDVEGNNKASDYSSDIEQIESINQHGFPDLYRFL